VATHHRVAIESREGRDLRSGRHLAVDNDAVEAAIVENDADHGMTEFMDGAGPHFSRRNDAKRGHRLHDMGSIDRNGIATGETPRSARQTLEIRPGKTFGRRDDFRDVDVGLQMIAKNVSTRLGVRETDIDMSIETAGTAQCRVDIMWIVARADDDNAG